MTHNEIRKKFLDFFKKNGHKIVPSSSLVPDDPSVLFTTAGMQQFKPYYTGQADPIKDFGSLNTASIQKCVRTSDIDEVGDESHLTFFEMLGNFSFGGYWKKEAIKLAHEFITKEMRLKIDYVSVFEGDSQNSADIINQVPGDTESINIWKSLGIDNIKLGNRNDNFWGPTGNEGPCGPTTEIYVNGTEVWNIVFNEYYCYPGGRLEQLNIQGIDTGMGLERLATVIQKVPTIYETDLFTHIITEIRGKNLYDVEQNKKNERIIADHLRSAVFMVSDGFMPSNVEAGYVLRRLIRRAVRFIEMLNLPDDVYQRIIHAVVHTYKEVYPELESNKENIKQVITDEVKKFKKTLEKGMKEFQNITNRKTKISGEEAFNLFQTYGFPFEFTKELAQENKIEVDEKEFKEYFEKHREISRAGAEKKFGGHGIKVGDLTAADEQELKIKTKLHTATHLLHTALRNKFGPEVRQHGSDITAERLRFDFNFPRKLTGTELAEVERAVNEAIKKDYPVTSADMPFERAIEIGALAFFKNKYPEIVKVYTIGDGSNIFSREICGGPHVEHTGQIGGIKITKEESVGAGLRRIRAVLK